MFDFMAAEEEAQRESKRLRCPKQRGAHSITSEMSTSSDEEQPDGVMSYLDDAARAAAAASADAGGSCGATSALCSSKPHATATTSAAGKGSHVVLHSNGEAGASASRTAELSAEHTVTDLYSPKLCAAAATERRGKDEVDVAAEGIPLEVRRFQCTKSLLALKEATKNDSTPVSTKLVDYIVGLTTSSNGMCTEREMCDWLVAQLCDRMATGQMWMMAKTHNLLFVLLWRGSNSFANSVRERGLSLFHVDHAMSVMRRTPQENLPGDPLPCSLQPIKSAAAGQTSACNRAKPKPGLACPLERLRQMGHCAKDGAALLGLRPRDAPAVYANPAADLSERDMSFVYSNMAYMESLCEYRVRHPTVDLQHGEILCPREEGAGTGSLGSTNTSTTGSRRLTPVNWKELLDDTLELLKAIAACEPTGEICPIGVTMATTRMRNALVLYQIACRTLVRLVHSVLTTLSTWVNMLQTGLGLPPSAATPAAAPAPTPGSSASYLSGAGAAVDFDLDPKTVRSYAGLTYTAVYQFNRTVRMLATYCETTTHVPGDLARKVGKALKTLPDGDLVAFRDYMKEFQNSDSSAKVDRLFALVRQSIEIRSNGSITSFSQASPTGGDRKLDASTAASSPSSLVALTPTPSDQLTQSSMTLTSPLQEAGVREAMLDLLEVHKAHEDMKKHMWEVLANSVCDLFDEKESAMLHQIFRAGLDGLWGQWRDFTNNGAAAAEKVLTASSESSGLVVKNDSTSTPGISSTDGGASASGARNSVEGSEALTRSSTYILRSLPRGTQSAGGRGKADVISVKSSGTGSGRSAGSLSLERSTERSIEALLQEDDVVVICNEECSCNDNLKLVDRFQVLMDVPLGQGSYGKVFRAWDEVIGCYLAAKELPLDPSKSHSVAVREVLQEYTVLTELSHPNIVRVVAFMVLKQTARIYMEWMPSGSLQDVLRHHPRGVLRESVVRRYARDVLSGLTYLHSRGVIHRDVKPGNMLLGSDGTVKLTDFGTSLVLNGNNKTLESSAITGTAAYMAPECVQGTYSSASDIWSFGCTLVQLLSGSVPWYNARAGTSPEPIALLFKIGCLDDATHLERPHDALVAASVAARNAEEVTATLDTDVAGVTSSISSVPASTVSSSGSSALRPAEAAPAAPVVDVSEELIDMLNAIFVVDRKKRPSASELMQHPFFKVV